jgi:hypothetical protein
VNGGTYHCCSVCGYTYSNNMVEAPGHKYADGKCTVCGEAEGPGYFLFGYINGKNYACEEDYTNMGVYKFVNGKLTATFEKDSYIAVKLEGNAAWFMTNAYVQTTTGTFYNTDNGSYEKMFVPGGVELDFTLRENADGSLTLSYEKALPKEATVSGTITSYGGISPITVELWQNNVKVHTVTTTNGSYKMEKVVPGSYTVTVTKANHVTRKTTLTVTGKDVTLNLKLCLIGDVTGNGVVDVGDVARVYSHVQGNPITDPYAISCANPDGGQLNILDVVLIYSHVTGSNRLY